MNYTVTITYDNNLGVYQIGSGSWMPAWDNVNNTNISEFGFHVVGNQMTIQSEYQLTALTVDYSFPNTLVINNNTATLTDTDNIDFHAVDLFVFQITYIGNDGVFACENIYGDTVNVFEFAIDGVIYGTNDGDSSIAAASINPECCSFLGYTFDPDNAKCYWSPPCVIDDYIKIIINPEGNDGVIFEVDETENCSLDISFDWLLEYDCESLLGCVNSGTTIMSILSGVTLSVSLERIVEAPLNRSIPRFNQIQSIPYVPESVYQSVIFSGANILDYFTNSNSGIILVGDDCEVVTDIVELELTSLFSGFTENNLYSGWMHFETSIVDPTILALIRNEKIKLALEIQNSGCDMSVLVDNIQLNRNCEFVDIEETFIATCPSFELDRIIDNKKSWVAKTEFEEREFNLRKRETDYYINHHKLGINSKEVDLNVSPSRAIETDVMNIVLQNPCMLHPRTFNNIMVDLQDNLIYINGVFQPNEENDFTNNDFGFTTEDNVITIYSKYPILSGEVTAPEGTWDVQDFSTPYQISFDYDFSESEFWSFDIVTIIGDGDIVNLITTSLTDVFTLEEFIDIISSELIDVKDRQTIRDYPVLRMLYERYLNSLEACGFSTNEFNYSDMDSFISLIGSYWVDLVEQVIPSTTIWGSTYKYSNTVFDRNKFKYRKGTLFTCEESTIIPTIGSEPQIEVIKTITTIDDTGKPITTTESCRGVYMNQIDDGSEFLGSVTIVGDGSLNTIRNNDYIILNEFLGSSNIINE